MKAFISANDFALAHYYLVHCQNFPIPEETLDHYRNLALRHMPEDQSTLLRRPGLKFYEEDFSPEIKEIAHHLQKTLKKKLTI